MSENNEKQVQAQEAAEPEIHLTLTPQELEENIGAMELKLPDGLAERLTAATEPVKEKLGGNSDMWFSGEASRVF